MAQARRGDTVMVHYSGTLEDGTVFSSTYEEKNPFEFTIGEGSALPSFENEVVGMTEGDKKSISIPPEDAYGHHRKELVFTVKRTEMPPDIALEQGKRLRVRSRDGTMLLVSIVNITEDSVILDANDPLAGQTLEFEIELVKIL
jgi:peptidylprolyl isomerase